MNSSPSHDPPSNRDSPSKSERERGPILLSIARTALLACLGSPQPRPVPEEPLWLSEWGASFITLRNGGELRGCIGSTVAWRALGEDVRENTLAAASKDLRFHPIGRDELSEITLEVTELSPLENLPCSTEDLALRSLRPGSDGVVISYRSHRATFLPQVWKQLPVPRNFLAALKEKANLAKDFWHEDLKLQRYSTLSYRSKEPLTEEPLTKEPLTG